MAELITKIIEYFENLSMKRIVTIFVVGIIVIICFPLLDYYFYFNIRTNNRIEILENLSSLNMNVIENNKILLEEYNDILEEVQKHSDGIDFNLNGIVSRKADSKTNFYKFLSGGFWGWLIVVLCPFIYKTKIKDMIIGILLFGLLGAILGWVATLVPTFSNVNINYFVVPILQLLLGIVIGVYISKRNKKEKGQSTIA